MRLKNLFLKISLCLVLLLLGINNVSAKEAVVINVFHSESCSHCKEEIEYINTLSNVEVNLYEITNNNNLVSGVRKALKIENSYVPLTVVGSHYLIGYNDDIKEKINRLIDGYTNESYCDLVSAVKSGESISECFLKNEDIVIDDNTRILPWLGKVNVKNVSLPLLAIVIGLVDGFNPCAMWILVFLISMLINMKDRKKMLILGLTFIISSALVYLLIMVSWLKITTSLFSTWFKYLVAIVSIVLGGFSIYNYIKSLKSEDGCQVTNQSKRKKIIEKIKHIVVENNYLLAIIGMMVLAFSVNMIELACSAGLPVLFMEVLSVNDLSATLYLIYLLIYIFFFMLDDIIVFLIAVFTLKITGISNKYTKYSHLIGGIIMIVLGALLIFKPEIIMFNF